jgi:hypothetical protein
MISATVPSMPGDSNTAHRIVSLSSPGAMTNDCASRSASTGDTVSRPPAILVADPSALSVPQATATLAAASDAISVFAAAAAAGPMGDLTSPDAAAAVGRVRAVALTLTGGVLSPGAMRSHSHASGLHGSGPSQGPHSPAPEPEPEPDQGHSHSHSPVGQLALRGVGSSSLRHRVLSMRRWLSRTASTAECRICLEDASGGEPLLESPCACTGGRV